MKNSLKVFEVDSLSKNTFLGSSTVEQATVNRLVAGSNPARGAIYPKISKTQDPNEVDPIVLTFQANFAILSQLKS